MNPVRDFSDMADDRERKNRSRKGVIFYPVREKFSNWMKRMILLAGIFLGLCSLSLGAGEENPNL